MTDNDLHYDPAYDEFLLARKRELLRELERIPYDEWNDNFCAIIDELIMLSHANGDTIWPDCERRCRCDEPKNKMDNNGEYTSRTPRIG